jgi:hypothetical protein
MTRSLGVIALAAWAACVPLYPKVREERQGKVVDDHSGAPVAKASIRVESYQVMTPPRDGGGGRLLHSLEVKSESDGTWKVPSERDWTIGILAADGLPLYVDVYCVFAAGYQAEFRNPHRDWLEPVDDERRIDRQRERMPFELRLHRSTGTALAPSQFTAQASRKSPCGVPEMSAP